MIIIRELKSDRIPTETSLSLSFDYNPKIIEILHQAEMAIWKKREKEWEVPITSLSYLIDNLCYIDDIKIITLPEEEINTNVNQVVEYRTNPFKYQNEGIRYGLCHNKWLLLDAPGLGKTLQITYLAEELKKQQGLEHCLIICGINTLKSNWESEILKHSSLDCKILGKRITRTGSIDYGSVSKRCEQLKNKIDEFFIITNIETIRNKKFIEAFNHSENKIDMIVVDEAHKIKNSGSQQGDALLSLDSKYKVSATGTAILNSPLDIYAQLKWIGKIDSCITNFKKYYCILGGESGFQVVGYKNIQILKNIIDSCSLRRTKDVIDLPPKTIINEYIDLYDDESKFYDSIKNGVKSEADKVNLNTSNLLALTTRLREATSCPSMLTSQKIISSKLDRAQDLADQLISQGEKVVISCGFKESIRELSERLKQYNPLIITGDEKVNIEEIKSKFQNDPDKKLLIFTWQKMGVGHTLNAASYMICIDTAWTDGTQTQTEDRIHRVGTKKPVFIYRLWSKNTFDERVKEILEDKKAISDFMIDGVISENGINRLRKFIQEL